jgi:outer membrane protein OmpA-like peptidoglycan-associated protein
VQRHSHALLLPRPLTFVGRTAKLTNESRKLLGELAQYLAHHHDIRHVRIVAHTDNAGGHRANRKLSVRRAQAVRTALVGHKVPAKHLTAQGLGDSDPIASNKHADGRHKNMRVEFIVR